MKKLGRPRGTSKITINKDIALIHCKHCDFIIDANQVNKIKDFRWFSKLSYATNKYYAYSHYEGNYKILLSRYLLDAWDSKVIVDHKNGDTLDNRLENLRLGTRRQNNFNAKKRKNCKSKYKGLCKLPSGKWSVHLTIDGKQIHGGKFWSELEAALSYNKLAKKYFGEFAWLNQIEENIK